MVEVDTKQFAQGPHDQVEISKASRHKTANALLVASISSFTSILPWFQCFTAPCAAIIGLKVVADSATPVTSAVRMFSFMLLIAALVNWLTLLIAVVISLLSAFIPNPLPVVAWLVFIVSYVITSIMGVLLGINLRRARSVILLINDYQVSADQVMRDMKSRYVQRFVEKDMTLGFFMSSGTGSPISVHTLYPEWYAAAFSVVREVLLARGALERKIKEAAARKVSEMNECTLCVAAHDFMRAAAAVGTQPKSKEDVVVSYVEYLMSDDMHKNDVESKLTVQERLEVAMLIFQFHYLNLVVECILGKCMTGAMSGTTNPFRSVMEHRFSLRLTGLMLKPLIGSSMKRGLQPGLSLKMVQNVTNGAEYTTQPALPRSLAFLEKANSSVFSQVLTNFVNLCEFLREDLEERDSNMVEVFQVVEKNGLEQEPPVANHVAANKWIKGLIHDLPDEVKPGVRALLKVCMSPQAVRSTALPEFVRANSEFVAHGAVMWISARIAVKKLEAIGEKGQWV